MNPYQFFLKHAGYSYDPATQSPMQGHIQNARQLAATERKARDAGISFSWAIDTESDSCEISGELPYYKLWVCTAHSNGVCEACKSGQSRVLASLGGIDFGRDGEPWGNPYRRVVEAKLALEALDQLSEVQS